LKGTVAPVIGLISYFWKGKARLSFNLTFLSYSLIMFASFVKCQNDFQKKAKCNKELAELMSLIYKYRGTELEEQFQQKYKEKVQELDRLVVYKNTNKD
jgi:hypothetical protein